MRRTVLKPFPFYTDGFTPTHLEAEQEFDFPEGMVAGLEAAGLIAPTDGVKPAPENKMIDGAPEGGDPVKLDKPEEPEQLLEIPDNWTDLSWPEKRSLASQLSEDPIENKEAAHAAIEAEIAKRAAAEGNTD